MRLLIIRLSLLLSLLVISSFNGLGQDLEARLKEIDDYAVKTGQDWKVPGFAVAIVKDDKVVFAKGYGVRELNKSETVDADTLFAIASNSKAFTAAALAILVDEGKVKWDDPVTKYLPWFQLYDPWVTREMTLRDLLSHRSGLATFSGDLLWYESEYSREELVRRLRFIKPVSSFRSRFGYQNIMYVAAGEVILAVTGKTWDEFIRERFFAPLGMTRTITSHQQLSAATNVATPHNETEGKLRVIRYGKVDNAGAAGAIKSSVTDIAQWIRLQLGRGTFSGKKIFSADRSREMWTPHILFSAISEQGEKLNPTTHFNMYGLGWLLNDYQGRKIISHGGGLDGMVSRVALIPEEGLGVVVLTNSESAATNVISNRIVDLFIGAPRRDWNAELLGRFNQSKATEQAAIKKVEDSRIPNTKPSLPLASYAGTYGGVMYGDAKVSEENGKLVVRFVPSPLFVGDLEHWHFDIFRIKWRDSIVYPFRPGFVSFIIDNNGKVSEMKIDVPNQDFDFKELEFKRTP
jgi:CubicO group peptidase (beta-lactamase class C family)